MSRLCLCILLFCLLASHALAGPLTVITENNPPFTYLENHKAAGLTTDILLAVAQEAQIEIEREDIQLWPWARGYEMVQTTPGVLLYPTSKTPERALLFKWVGPIITVAQSIMALKKTAIETEALEDFVENHRIGTVRDTASEQLLLKKGVRIGALHRVHDLRFNVEKLIERRLDCIIHNEIASRYMLNKRGYGADKVQTVMTLDTTDHYFALSKGTDPQLVKRLQDALDRLKADGSIDAIMAHYLN